MFRPFPQQVEHVRSKPFLRHFHGVSIDVKTHVLPAGCFGCNESRATSAEWIKNYLGSLRSEFNQCLEELRRLLGHMATTFTPTKTCSEDVIRRSFVRNECLLIKCPNAIGQHVVSDCCPYRIGLDEPKNGFKRGPQIPDAPAFPLHRTFQIATSLEHNAEALGAMRSGLTEPRERVPEREPCVLACDDATVRESATSKHQRGATRLQDS